MLDDQLDRVDPLYYARTNRLDIAEETRLLADAPTAKAFRDANHEGQSLNESPYDPNFLNMISFAGRRSYTQLHLGHILPRERISALRTRDDNS